MKRVALLWTGLLAGPVIWFLNLETNFALAPTACLAQTKTQLHAVSIVSLALAAGCVALSASQLRQLRVEPQGDAVADERLRGMAFAGIALGVFSFLVILAQSIPNLILAGCE